MDLNLVLTIVKPFGFNSNTFFKFKNPWTQFLKKYVPCTHLHLPQC